ncbi:uncharacterized protein Z519_03862 [Cladophialophora bantiana CBS 173.52]|uniref:Uncharacterized protein n=1 Tax=Cladophialophora bantiana (strain ATCC 10958 / CBS 173.52 / CDC B-1940 / NIH 8579) TaxID=1442370 RepID=A0A0D2HPF1_CLAB1|nr:uncharacterized protein Z519_03862 [Cladophialophora bantiana CBS 173.52]KIW95278.1 hypothetical protein Z519_03862 [Cladophialophora bantiana CBS 173.52]
MWGQLVHFYRMEGCGPEAKYKLMFLTALICFGEEINMRAIPTLIAFAILDDLKTIDLPSWPSYSQFRPGFRPKIDYLRQLLTPCAQPSPPANAQSQNQKGRKAAESARKLHEVSVARRLVALAEFLCDQWPRPLPNFDGFSTDILDLEKASSLIAVEWNAMFRNHKFEEHMRQVQEVLDKHRSPEPLREGGLSKHAPSLTVPRGFPLICPHLLKKDGPRVKAHQTKVQNRASCHAARTPASHSHQDIRGLRRIVQRMSTSKSFVRQGYLRGLLDSITALEGYRSQPFEKIPVIYWIG